MRIGVCVFGIASIAAGITDLIWGEFEPGHQPIQAFGDNIPGREILAYLAAVWLIAGGAAILWHRTARFGAAALALIYFIFAVFSFPRFYTAPQVLGYRFPVYIGVFDEVGQELILAIAAAVLYASETARGSLPQPAALIARSTFGLCSVDFGLSHLTGVQGIAPMVPAWLPFGGDFWAVFTGIAFVLAGLGIVSGILDVLASRLLGLMLLGFSVLLLAPALPASLHDHEAWGGTAYNLAAAGAAWIFAAWLATRRQPVRNQPSTKRTKPSLA